MIMTTPPTSLILIHGFASSFEHNWRRTGWVDILADFGCDVPAIDLPGHGSSIRSSSPVAYEDVEGQLFDMIPRSPAICAVGFSVGANLLLRMAIAHPDAFAKIALLGIGDMIFESDDPSRMVQALIGPEEPEDIQARLFRGMASSSGNDPYALAAFLQRSQHPLQEDQLSKVKCPVLVVLGDRDMSKSADRLVAALPSATFTSLAGVDHFATTSDFAAIDAVMRFFEF
jgi:pimeloyl-ACP methyl ester carboxylesterase